MVISKYALATIVFVSVITSGCVQQNQGNSNHKVKIKTEVKEVKNESVPKRGVAYVNGKEKIFSPNILHLVTNEEALTVKLIRDPKLKLDLVIKHELGTSDILVDKENNTTLVFYYKAGEKKVNAQYELNAKEFEQLKQAIK